jgi:flavin reductase (DIM6/NTAB) family NADH-FMN oxidoreductase RutF
MLLPNTTVWHTRVQNVDSLLTAVGVQGTEVYRLATVCQVGLEPPMVSISPNPEYPICARIDAAGYFGLNLMAASQAALVARCYALPRANLDKAAMLGLGVEHTERGTPLLLECIQSLEVRVEHAWNSGDHRTYIGTVVSRRLRKLALQPPHRFGGRTPAGRRLLKRVACQTGLYDFVMRVRNRLRPPLTIEQGTRRHIPTPTAGEHAPDAE